MKYYEVDDLIKLMNSDEKHLYEFTHAEFVNVYDLADYGEFGFSFDNNDNSKVLLKGIPVENWKDEDILKYLVSLREHDLKFINAEELKTGMDLDTRPIRVRTIKPMTLQELINCIDGHDYPLYTGSADEDTLKSMLEYGPVDVLE